MGYSYTRIGNPTVAAFEQQITRLEGGAASVACASGMAAITYALLNILSAGDEIISSTGLYGGTIDLFRQVERFGIHVCYVDLHDVSALEAALNEHTKVLFAETLSNPSLAVADIPMLAEIAHRHGIPLIVDNTMASAYLIQPLALGADIVVNSSSKYINGTGNSISGVITDACHFSWDTERFPMMKEVARMGKMGYTVRLRSDMLTNHGGCLSPQNAHLNLLGLETMGIRMERECSNAFALARHLSGYPGVTVNYPGLPGAPGHELAKRLMHNGFGTVLTIRLGSRERAIALMDSLKLVSIVSNVGDIRTMVVHPASTMALHSTPQELEGAGVYDDLIRISVGIENIGDLIADFDRALDAASH
jgi:O-acetylhomoserine (thiol)-lyase